MAAKNTIAVTGAAGVWGGWLAQRLHETGHRRQRQPASGGIGLPVERIGDGEVMRAAPEDADMGGREHDAAT